MKEKLLKIFGDKVLTKMEENKLLFRRHPLVKMFTDLESEKHTSNYFKAQKLANAIIYAYDNYRKSFEELKTRITCMNDDYNDAIGLCSEFRCLKSLVDSDFEVEFVDAMRKQTRPDFKVKDHYNHEFYIEVFTPRMNNNAVKKLKEFYKGSTEECSKRWKVNLTAYSPIAEGERLYMTAIKKRLLSNKSSGKQAVPNNVNILWIDLNDSELILGKRSFLPLLSTEFKDKYLTVNPIIWHAFYTKRDQLVFEQQEWIKYYDGGRLIEPNEVGIFRDNCKWSGVIFNLDKSQILYENPWCKEKIPEQLKSSLVRLSDFDIEASWIDKESTYLEKRIDNKLEEMERLHDMMYKWRW